MMQTKPAILAVMAALGTVSAPAGAAVVTRAYVTTASFTNAPIAAVSLSYTPAYDPAATFPGGMIGNYTATLNAGPFAGPVGADFRFGNYVVIGKNASGINGVTEGADDFVASFYDASGAPSAETTTVYFTRAGGSGTFVATAASTALATSTVPEPATWSLMILDLGGVGASVRRRRSGTVLA